MICLLRSQRGRTGIPRSREINDKELTPAVQADLERRIKKPAVAQTAEAAWGEILAAGLLNPTGDQLVSHDDLKFMRLKFLSFWPDSPPAEVAERDRLRTQVAELTELRRLWSEDSAAEHTHLVNLCLAAGIPKEKVEGDSYGVPGIADLADLLAAAPLRWTPTPSPTFPGGRSRATHWSRRPGRDNSPPEPAFPPPDGMTDADWKWLHNGGKGRDLNDPPAAFPVENPCQEGHDAGGFPTSAEAARTGERRRKCETNPADIESDLRIAHTRIERLDQKVSGQATALTLIGLAVIVLGAVSILRSFS